MFRFIFRSKFFITSIVTFILALTCMGCLEISPNDIEGNKYVIHPYDHKSKDDLRWSEYLYKHLKKRGGEFSPVFYEEKVENCTNVYFHLDTELAHDFTVKNKGNAIYLTTRSASNAVWLIHQFMRHIGDRDDRFPSDDLPATLLTFADTTGNFTFKYRDIYAPPSLNEDIRGVLALNNIDESWGIWGHNIGVTVLDKSDLSIYASIKGIRNSEQYCFTSEKLYHYIEKYINSNYGKGTSKSMNFAILPNDNNLVCQCPGCVAEGNTATNATPAVTSMIKRLAKQFKQHKFFTSAYHTTKVATQEKLPDNVGVLVSVIDWQPNRKTDDRQKKNLETMLNDWGKVCKHIYIWDYINNYDDYFTPYPILMAIQDRFKFYKEKGIEGVFLNGSGYDYSTFSDMETCVLAALMMNVNLDVKQFIYDYFYRMYPTTGTIIAEFYFSMLDKWSQSQKVMPYYGGIEEKMNVYLDADKFVEFYNQIIRLKKHAGEEEAYLLRRLITTLSFTRLEIARHLGHKEHGYAQLENGKMIVKEEVEEWLEVFNDGYKAYNLTAINESGDLSADYVNSWKQYLLSDKIVENSLLNKKVTLTCDEGTSTIQGLTDGELGLPVNYYYGWNILPYKEVTLTLPAGAMSEGKTLAMNIFSYIRHRIHVPSKIEVYEGKKLLCSEKIDMSDRDGAFQTKWEKRLPQATSGKISIKLYSTGNYHLAIDELFITR